ncbi:MAG: hypothetical protein J6S41_08270, partial [Clostridia bacterium]|nr:hypothetical protein [Clostridia bacterium]
MRTRKLLSFLLCAALLIGLVPLGSLALSTAAAETTDVVAYVSTAATGSGTLGDSEDPYPTLSAAITALNAAATDGDRIAKIKDATYKISTTDGSELAEHENLIIVEGATGSETVDLISVYGLNGPIKFDNIQYTFSGGNTSSLSTGGYALEFGENATYTASGSNNASGRIYASYGSSTTMSASTDPYELTISDKFFSVYLCGYNKSLTIPGFNFVMNGGSINSSGGIYIGANADAYTTTYSGNVNLEINGGTVGGIKSANYVNRSTFTNGAALQIIYNNGTSCSNVTLTEESVINAGGKLYILNSETGGSTLHATATAGVFSIADTAWMATATDGTNTYTSENGILKIDAAGEYTVTWEEAPEEEEPVNIGSTVYVKYDGGSDATTTGAEDAPFKTLTAAIKALDAVETTAERTVVILDAEYNLKENDASSTVTNHAQLPSHTHTITIKGANGTNNKLVIGGHVVIGGPLKFGAITCQFPSSGYPEFSVAGHALEF